ncbi:MAG: O-antigen ligase family protein, partial [Moritella sp.]|nr:O-antigen ligase family protein [Moritella sp.]
MSLPVKDNTLFYLFLFILVWIPLPLGSNRPWSAMLMCLGISVLCLLWNLFFVTGRVKISKTFIKAWPVLSLLLLSVFFVVYQFFMRQSIDLETTFLELIQSISLLLLFSMALLLVNSSRRIKLTIITLVASGLFQALFGSLMTLSGIEYTFFLEKESYIGVATGTFINRNHLAGYLVICLSLGLGMMIASLKGSASSLKEFSRNFLSAILSQKAPLRISLVIMVAALVMTHSRMGNTAFFASMGIIGTLTILLKKRSAGSTILLLVSLLVIDIAVVGSFFGVDKVINRLEQTSIDKETRDEVNLYSIKIIEDNLLQGTGAGTFYTSFPQVREREVGFLFYDHAHNDYFEFLTERGVIGSAPLLLAVILTFIMSLYALWKRRNPLMRGCAFACSMSMLAMAIHAS